MSSWKLLCLLIPALIEVSLSENHSMILYFLTMFLIIVASFGFLEGGQFLSQPPLRKESPSRWGLIPVDSRFY